MGTENHISQHAIRCKDCQSKIYFITKKKTLDFKCAVCGNMVHSPVLEPEFRYRGSPLVQDPILQYTYDAKTLPRYRTKIALLPRVKNVPLTPAPKTKVPTHTAQPKKSTSITPTKTSTQIKTATNISQSKYDIKKPSAIENTVYFDLSRLKDDDNLQDLFLRYPKLVKDFSDDPSNLDAAKRIIKSAFPERMPVNYVLARYELPGNGDSKRINITIRTTLSLYLKPRIDPNCQMSLSGFVGTKSIFCVTGIDVVPDNGNTEEEKQVLFQIRYGIPDNTCHFFQDTIKSLATYGDVVNDDLQLWSDYLEWKQQLTKLKIRGVKYIGFRLTSSDDIDTDGISFLCAAENSDEAKNIARHFQRERDNIIIYTNQVSKSRWEFDYNPQSKADKGIPLVFSRLVTNDYPDDEEWDINIRTAQKPSNESESKFRVANAKQMLRKTQHHSYLFELYFTLPADIIEDIQERELHGDELESYLSRTLLSRLCFDGFIANSRIGDFALNNRLLRALSDLRAGKATSNNLGNWIFDISKARAPKGQSPNVVWSDWGGEHLNESQKKIVLRALQSPDVFLCQGPPGTGKTTVIAEIVYQLTRQGKRVLIASQTNLAVNNALSKLLNYPNIRAIRLGSDRKMDESVEPIRDQNILRTFFTGVERNIQKQYLNLWASQGKELATLQQDLQYCTDLLAEKKDLNDQADTISFKMSRLEASLEDLLKNELAGQEKSLLEHQKACYASMNSDLQDKHYPPFKATLPLADAQNLLIYLRSDLEKLIAIGYHLLPVYVDMADGFSRISEGETNDILFNIASLSLVLSGPSNNDADTVEAHLQALRTEMQQLEDSDEDDFIAFTRIRAIRKELKAIENGDSAYTNPLKQVSILLPDDVQKQLSNGQEFSIDQTTVLIADDIIVKIRSFLEQKINDAKAKLSSSSTAQNALRSQQEDLIKRKADLQEQQERNNAELHALCEQYGTEHDYSVSRIIEQRIQNIRSKGNPTVPRADFEGFLNRFVQYIDSVGDDYAQENEVYLTSFINACNVVGISCTESSSTLTDNGFKTFDVAIIDEVSKATPPEILLPLLISQKAILVGDHRQLPPLFGEHYNSYQECVQELDPADTEAKKLLTKANYERFEELVTNSLFKKHYEQASRLNKGSLLTQYRMHHEIMDVVNIFYDGQLNSGYTAADEEEKKKHYAVVKDTAGYTALISPEHHAYWIDTSKYDNHPIYEKTRGTSKYNRLEARAIVEALKQIDESYQANGQTTVDIGIISFYAEQVRLIKDIISKECHFKVLKCDINTVDRFQGKEKAIVFVSLVRNVRDGARFDATFVKDYRRINVAMSRAQSLLLIVGAKNMYDDQEIIIENMENGKPLPPVRAYHEIIQSLIMKGCYILADDIIDRQYEDSILAE